MYESSRWKIYLPCKPCQAYKEVKEFRLVVIHTVYSKSKWSRIDTFSLSIKLIDLKCCLFRFFNNSTFKITLLSFPVHNKLSIKESTQFAEFHIQINISNKWFKISLLKQINNINLILIIKMSLHWNSTFLCPSTKLNCLKLSLQYFLKPSSS